MIKIKKIVFIFIIMFISSKSVIASGEFCSLNNYSIKIDGVTIKSGYTISAYNNNLKIGIFPDVLLESTRINLKNISKLDNDNVLNNAKLPEGWSYNGDIYEYDILNKNSYNKEKALVAEIAFGKDSDNYKKIFYLDESLNKWIELPSSINWVEKTVRTKLYFSYVKIAILDRINIRSRGEASWYNQAPHRKLFINYNYHDADYGASNRYSKGSKLRITNLDNDKYVDIIVNDCGPVEWGDWQARIIDLDIRAFKKIGNYRLGVLRNISVEPIEITKIIDGCY